MGGEALKLAGLLKYLSREAEAWTLVDRCVGPRGRSVLPSGEVGAMS